MPGTEEFGAVDHEVGVERLAWQQWPRLSGPIQRLALNSLRSRATKGFKQVGDAHGQTYTWGGSPWLCWGWCVE